MDESFHSAGVGTIEAPAKLKQEVIYLKQRIEYQQSLLEDERKVTDDLLANKNRAIDSLQLRLKAAQDTHRSEMDSFQHKIDEVGYVYQWLGPP